MEMVNFKKVVLACWLFFGTCILLVLVFYATVISSFVEGKQVIPEKYRGLEHKGTIKTIVSPDDVIDCVDFYKQPAFDDPRIRKDFKMESHLFPDETDQMTNDELHKLGLYQNWLKYGECPNETIPIRRTLNRDTYMKKRIPNRGSSAVNAFGSHEYAITQLNYDAYFGARANIDLWNPSVEFNDFSLAQVWVAFEDEGHLEVMEAGWIVYTTKFDDLHTRFFVFWTNDSYESGCWNLECSGFVQLTNKITIGGPINSISSYNGTRYYIELAIYKENKQGDWWMSVNGKKFGYWPKSLFKDLQTFSQVVQWGGEVYNTGRPGYHTITEMGSGHFPNEGINKAGSVTNLAVLNADLNWVNVSTSDLRRRVSRLECYNAIIRAPTDRLGTHFFYGGNPSYYSTCK